MGFTGCRKAPSRASIWTCIRHLMSSIGVLKNQRHQLIQLGCYVCAHRTKLAAAPAPAAASESSGVDSSLRFPLAFSE